MVQLSGHLKGEVYLEAALMFMMSCYENEVSEGDSQWAGNARWVSRDAWWCKRPYAIILDWSFLLPLMTSCF